jgi:hypothetical protein
MSSKPSRSSSTGWSRPFGAFSLPVRPVRLACRSMMSYGISLTEVYQQLGAYAGRSLKGAKLIDLPIVRSVTFESSSICRLLGRWALRCLRRCSLAPTAQRHIAASAHGRCWHFSAVPTARSNVRFQGVKQPCRTISRRQNFGHQRGAHALCWAPPNWGVQRGGNNHPHSKQFRSP